MSEFKGTKGKWERYSSEKQIAVVNEDKNQAICFLPDLYGKTESNALLISKAPEMLEMLEKLIDRLEENDLGNLNAVRQAKELIKEATEL